MCVVTVHVTTAVARVLGPGTGGCDLIEISPPACTLAQVWEQASQRTGVPGLVAGISLHRFYPGGAQWWIVLPDRSNSIQIADICP